MTINVFYVVNRRKETNELIIDVDEIIGLFKNEIKILEKKLKRKFPCEYEFIQATDANENILRFGYLWISSNEIFNMCKGLNPDGSERKVIIKKKFDPKVYQRVMKKFIESPIKPGETWADIAEQEEELKRKYSGIEERQLDKLIDLDKWMSMYEKFVITPIKVKNTCRTLICTRTPKCVTPEMIKSHFTKFTTKLSVIKLDNDVTKIVFDDPIECGICLELRKKIKVKDDNNRLIYLIFKKITS